MIGVSNLRIAGRMRPTNLWYIMYMYYKNDTIFWVVRYIAYCNFLHNPLTIRLWTVGRKVWTPLLYVFGCVILSFHCDVTQVVSCWRLCGGPV
jgi:hypothetical protein